MGLLCSWDSPGENTGVGCHFLLQGIYPTQGLNLCPLRWQENSLPRSHHGSPFEKKNYLFAVLRLRCSTWDLVPWPGKSQDTGLIKSNLENMFLHILVHTCLFAITKRWKQPRCPLMDEWINKLSSNHVMGYYWAIKRKEALIPATMF